MAARKILTDAQYIKKSKDQAEVLRALIKNNYSPFDDNSPTAKKKRKAECENSIEKFIQTYLPHYARDESAPFHPMMDATCKIKNKIVIVNGFRGCAKTVRLLIADLLMDICFQREHVVVVGSVTEKAAVRQSQQIRIEIEENARIKNDFGNLRGKYWKAADYTANGVKIVSIGVEQSLRGLLEMGWRLTKAVLDDMYDDQRASSALQVKKALDFIRSALIPAMDPGGWRIRMLGQPLIHGSAMHVLLNEKRPDGTPVHHIFFIEGCDSNFVSNWRDRFPDEYWRELYIIMGSVAFNKEIRCQIVDVSELFKWKWMQRCRYTQATRPPLSEFSIFALGIDPSLGLATGDPSAIILVGFHLPTRKFYVLGCRIGRIRPDKQAATMGVYHRKFPAAYGLAETNLFAELLVDPIKKHCPMMAIIKINNTLPKPARIGWLSKPLETGDILFDEELEDTAILVNQIFQYGEAEHDDGPDDLAMIINNMKERFSNLMAQYESLEQRESYAEMAGY